MKRGNKQQNQPKNIYQNEISNLSPMKHQIFFLKKVLFLLHFGSCQSCMRSANLFSEIHENRCNKRVLSTAEPCTCEYVTLLQSFHRGTLNIHRYIVQNFQPTFSISVLFRRLFRIFSFSRFPKAPMATSNFMKKFYNGGFAPGFSVSMLEETIALVRDYVSETRK